MAEPAEAGAEDAAPVITTAMQQEEERLELEGREKERQRMEKVRAPSWRPAVATPPPPRAAGCSGAKARGSRARPCVEAGLRGKREARAEWRVGLFESSLRVGSPERQRSQLPFQCRGTTRELVLSSKCAYLDELFLTLNRNLAF